MLELPQHREVLADFLVPVLRGAGPAWRLAHGTVGSGCRPLGADFVFRGVSAAYEPVVPEASRPQRCLCWNSFSSLTEIFVKEVWGTP